LEPATTLSKTLQEPKRPQPTGRPTTTRLSTEFQVEPEAHHAAHRQRIQELEDQNAVLVERNMMLEQNVQELQQKTQRLQKELREARRSARQVEWTAQEEQEWHTSRRLRRQEQDLIKSPLKQHLTKVEDTFQINHRWLVESGKPHYALSYPKWWTGAKELDARDHSLALEPHHELGGEKRKTNPDLDQYKRLKKY
jgi:predicted RNase H-like nuclease (RuvC/YqgF family)